MIMHITDVETGEYVESREAKESPREPGVFRIPAGAITGELPKVGDDEKLVLEGDKFIKVKKFKDPEPLTKDELDVLAKNKVKTDFLIVENEPILFKDKYIQMDNDSVRRMQSYIMAAIINPTYTEVWYTDDKTSITLEHTDFMNIAALMACSFRDAHSGYIKDKEIISKMDKEELIEFTKEETK